MIDFYHSRKCFCYNIRLHIVEERMRVKERAGEREIERVNSKRESIVHLFSGNSGSLTFYLYTNHFHAPTKCLLSSNWLLFILLHIFAFNLPFLRFFCVVCCNILQNVHFFYNYNQRVINLQEKIEQDVRKCYGRGKRKKKMSTLTPEMC